MLFTAAAVLILGLLVAELAGGEAARRDWPWAVHAMQGQLGFFTPELFWNWWTTMPQQELAPAALAPGLGMEAEL